LDCHGVCTALASTYRLEDREIGSKPEIWYATVSMTVEYLRPTPIAEMVQLIAQPAAVEDRFASVECVLAAADKERARATVRVTRVPDSWRHGSLT